MPFRTLSFLAAEARCIKWTSGMKGRRGVLRADLVVGDNAVSDSMLFETLVFQIWRSLFIGPFHIDATRVLQYDS